MRYSDQIPVIVKAGPLGESKSKKAGRIRINIQKYDALRHEKRSQKNINPSIYICILSTNPYAGGKRWE